MSFIQAEPNIQAELAALRQELAALRRELTQRPHVALLADSQQRFLGQPLTITALVTHGPGGGPAVGVPVTLATTWGRLLPHEGAVRRLGGSVSGLTGLDGTLRADLLPSTAEDLAPHQRELLAGALGLLDGGATPGQAAAGLRGLAHLYRQSGSRELRRAVDLLFRDFGARPRANLEQRTQQTGEWPSYDAAVIAYVQEGGLAGATSSVLAAATLAARFDDWLGAWLQTYLQLAGDEDRIGQELSTARERGEPAAPMLDVIYTRVRSMVSSHPGAVGEYAAQRLASEAMRGFVLDSSKMPLDVQTQLFPAMTTASAAMATGTSAFETLSRVRADLNDDRLDARLATFDPSKIAGITAQLGDLRAQIAVKVDQSALQSALAGKVDQTTLQTALASKAEQAALANKVDTTQLEKALSTKADSAQLASKVDTTQLEKALSNKADSAQLEKALSTKLDSAALEAVLDQQVASRVDSLFDRSLPQRMNRALLEFRNALDRDLEVQFNRLRDEFRRP